MKKKKCIAYLSAFVLMVLIHYLIGMDQVVTSVPPSFSHTFAQAVCVDSQTTNGYYSVNNPTCLSLINDLITNNELKENIEKNEK